MDEIQQTQLIDDAFAGFADGPLASPLGADAVRMSVKRRRTRRRLAGAALAAMLVVAPVSAYASGAFDPTGPPTTPGAGASASVSASPTTPPTSASPSASGSPATTTPPITKDEVAHAKLDFGQRLGKSLCPKGKVQLHGTDTAMTTDLGAITVNVAKVVSVDFDGDGSPEAAAYLDCYIQDDSAVVLALDRAADGSITTLGTIVADNADATDSTTPREIFDIRRDGDGAIGVQVGDFPKSGALNLADIEHQWRSYALHGQHFQQTGGPTKWTTPTPTDLSVTMTPLTLPAASGGQRVGTFKVTVRNNGPATVSDVRLEVTATVPAAIGTYDFSIDLGIVGNDMTCLDPDNPHQNVCDLFEVAGGSTQTFTVTATSRATNDPILLADPDGLKMTATVSGHGLRVRDLTDSKPSNNTVTAAATLG
jgi:hypothetical protein